jgi:hypothetical protein
MTRATACRLRASTIAFFHGCECRGNDAIAHTLARGVFVTESANADANSVQSSDPGEMIVLKSVQSVTGATGEEFNGVAGYAAAP